jgi:hypothetical protein
MGAISREKPLSSSVERKCSLPTDTTSAPARRSRCIQLGTRPS